MSEAAKMVLAKALADREAILPILRSCRTEYFPEHYQPLYEAIRKTYLDTGSVDVTILKDANPKCRAALMTVLTDDAPLGDPRYWINKLSESYQQQRLYQAASEMARVLEKPQSFSASRLRAITLWDKALAQRMQSDLVRLADVNGDDAEKPYNPTGFTPWDHLTGGMCPGTVHVLAGRPGRGKTTFATQLARLMALAGKPSLLISLEMGVEQTTALARKQGDIDAPLYALQNAARSWRDLAVDLRWIIEAGKIEALFFDHLGYLTLPRNRGQSRVEEVGEILRGMRQSMRTMGTSAMLVCQLNRAITGRRSEEPELSDLRESGEIEQEADSVTFLWCKKEERHKGKAKFTMTLAKNRYGPEHRITVTFNRPLRRFEYGDEPPF